MPTADLQPTVNSILTIEHRTRTTKPRKENGTIPAAQRHNRTNMFTRALKKQFQANLAQQDSGISAIFIAAQEGTVANCFVVISCNEIGAHSLSLQLVVIEGTDCLFLGFAF